MLFALAASFVFAAATRADEPRLQYNRDVRPILSDACFRCHGPDRNARQADLRLDRLEGALADLGGHAAIVPGKPKKSELVRRILTKDDDLRMPPPDSEHKLTKAQIATLRRWVEEGAEYQPHWALIAPKRPSLPKTNTGWGKNEIDAFVLECLEREKLAPSPEADAATLIRRVTFDLTGLPPTLEEVEEFVRAYNPSLNPSAPLSKQDGETERQRDRETQQEEAYEALIDRLLASPRYGERMASWWLDAARYADTNGYQSDGTRFMWRWRDWVIEAFNSNQPFDAFTVEQLAGDLLDKPSLSQVIATGFNRNHRGNEEGGIIPEEFRVEYVADRVETTSTVWLGLTAGCARCHDHKFDPISQKEFYQLFAFFNNIDEPGKAIRDNNSPPLVKAPTREMEQELAALAKKVQAAEKACEKIEPALAAAQSAWEESLKIGETVRWSVDEGLALHFPLDGNLDSVFADEKNAKPQAEVVDGSPEYVEGQDGEALWFDGKRLLRVDGVPTFGEGARFSYGAWIRPESPREMAVVARMDEEIQFPGFGLFWDEGKLRAQFSSRLTDDAICVETKSKFKPGEWLHVLVTYDGSRKARGVGIYVNGEAQPLRTLSDTLNNPITTTASLMIGSRDGGLRFEGLIDDVRFYARMLTSEESAALGSRHSMNDLARIEPNDRTAEQQKTLRSYFLKNAAPAAMQKVYAARDRAIVEETRYENKIPTTMVMREMPEPRTTHVLVRGVYDNYGEQVSADVPAALPKLPEGLKHDRLALAKWLVDPKHPLTARVAVNRFWQLYFGTGLVKTTEDFGAQGQWPSHPELLDWLATEFIRTGWDVKQMQKTIVMSATYRQSSKGPKELLARDPENRLLARGPRFRLSAEAIRDQALAVSGLLTEKLGGPSVMPYQPEGLWEELTHTAKYKQAHGDDLYRRSLYVYWRRTIPPPGMSAFDASSRETCTVRQVRTNTPLQALTLLNDITYVEAARNLGQRMMRQTSGTDERIAYAFRLATSRAPSGGELKVLRAGYNAHLKNFRNDAEAVDKLLAVGESPVAEGVDRTELAASTMIASVILNLDEVVTKQ
jgi:cytochrome c553